MRKRLGIAVWILVVLAACSGQSDGAAEAPEPTETLFESFSLEEYDWDDRSVFEANLVAEARGVLTQLPQASVYHISLSIPPEIDPVTGSLAVRYTNAEDLPLDEVYFRLFPNVNGGQLEVANVRVDGSPVEAVFGSGMTSMAVPLGSPLEPGEAVEIEMEFRLQIAREMGGNFGLFGFFSDVLVLDTFYPMIPVYDREGWHMDEPSMVGDFTFNDASFYLVEVSAPEELTLVASGIEISRREDDGEQRVVFAAGPARDFYLAGSEGYTVSSAQFGETRIHSYALEGRDEHREMALQFGQLALRHFSERFGRYPYTEFDIISSPMLALGIEYPGIVGVNHQVYDSEKNLYADTPNEIILESVVAHEAGHQWFYNLVGNDQEGEPWLDESITQYATYLYYVDTYGGQGAQGLLSSFYSRWDAVSRDPTAIGQAAENYVGNEYSAIIYGRGAIFMVELEKFMGEEAFAELMMDYVQSNAWEVGTAEEFRALAEEHCECDLAEFWAEWVAP